MVENHPPKDVGDNEDGISLATPGNNSLHDLIE